MASSLHLRTPPRLVFPSPSASIPREASSYVGPPPPPIARFASCPFAPHAPPRRRRRSHSRASTPLSSPHLAADGHLDYDEGEARPLKKLRKSPAIAALAVFTSLAFAEADRACQPPSPAEEQPRGCSTGSSTKTLGLEEAFCPGDCSAGTSTGRRDFHSGLARLRLSNSDSDADENHSHCSSSAPSPMSSPIDAAGNRRRWEDLRLEFGLGLGLPGFGGEESENDESEVGWEELPPPYEVA